MKRDPSLIIALDLGTATSSAALVGRVDGRWRLLGSVAGPADVPVEPALAALAAGVRTADPDLATALRLPADPAEIDRLPRLVARSVRAPRLAVLAATARSLEALLAAAGSAGWRTIGLAAHGATDELAVARLLLEPDLAAVLLGAAEPPTADERRALGELSGLLAGAARRRPELRVLLAGGAALHAGRFMEDAGSGPGEGLPGAPVDPDGELATAAPILLPAAAPAQGASVPSAALREVLRAHRPEPPDGRDAIARATATLAEVLDRRIETIEIGFDGAVRCVAEPAGDGRGRAVHASVPAAALIPPEPDEVVLRGIIDWSTVPRDRHRLSDRLRELRRDPWGDAAGDGAHLRIAAARAAIGRLLRATPDLDAGPPDLLLAAGGAWAVAPPPAVLLALAELVRRPGTSGCALDAARLLGPLGAIEDDAERLALVEDLADDLLVPLGSVVIAGELGRVRGSGALRVEAGAATTELELAVGGMQLLDLPPGETARVALEFHDPVVVAGRGRGFEAEVSGGLGGLLVDLRNVPLTLPERADRRRELLASWQGAFWHGEAP